MKADRGGLVLEGIPVPPSSNNQYLVKYIKGRALHTSSPELRQWRRDFDSWALMNMQGIVVARSMVHGCAIELEAFVGLHSERVYTKKGTFKRVDVSNRLKALHDALAEVLLVDDSHFFCVAAEKFSVPELKDEQVIVRISPCQARTLKDIREVVF